MNTKINRPISLQASRSPADQSTAAAKITFKIGGKNNKTTAVAVSLDICAPKDEVEELFSIIKEIEKIHIYGSCVQKKDIQALASLLHQLLQLNCILYAQERLKSATRCFLQKTIDDMPRHRVESGYPGYRAYERELLAINDVLILMNNALYKAKITDSSTPLALHNPSEAPHHFMHLFIGTLLPKLDLDSFVQSIDDTDVCKTAWEERLSTLDPELLSHYFNEIIQLIRRISDHADRVELILYKINVFANSLTRRSSLFGIAMMFDVIKGSRSPTLLDEQEHGSITTELCESNQTLRTLKTQINQLCTADSQFNLQFAQFRQALTLSMEQHPLLKDMILTALQKHLIQQSVRSVATQTVQQYINRCVTRLSEPLPADLLPMLEILRAAYHNMPLLSRKHNKNTFLEAWIRAINQYPEKTYSECYRLTTVSVHANIQALVEERAQFGFFSRHRFKIFITALLQSEPDYEISHPVQYMTRTRRSNMARA